MKRYRAIGVMSGTSLDGVDLADVEFFESEGKWRFELGKHQFVAYNAEWKERLSSVMNYTAADFVKAHVEYGEYTAELLQDFIKNTALTPDVIGVHGHTVFHQPHLGFTSQIGDGASIAAITKSLVACDFRSMDVARGGQGAPLVPIGDQLLYNDYNIRINIGGFSNISYTSDKQLIAYDIGPANIILNHLSQMLNKEYDDKGSMAKTGILDDELLKKLNKLEYYFTEPPKSLGKEWVSQFIFPLITEKENISDLLRTFVEHIAVQVVKSIHQSGIKEGTVLITGGGAFNTFLIDKIQEYSNLTIIIPPKAEVEMKEAIIFAFLGVLRMLNKTNILAEVTGAKCNSIAGALYEGRLK